MEWQRKGATLSDKTARQELSQGTEAHSPGNGDGQRPNLDLLLTMPGGFV